MAETERQTQQLCVFNRRIKITAQHGLLEMESDRDMINFPHDNAPHV